MTGNDEAGEVCPACQGLGKTKRFRKTPLIVGVAALPFLVLGFMLSRHFERNPETGHVIVGLSSIGTSLAFLVFAAALLSFFERAMCSECGGRGTVGGPSEGAPFIFREDRYRLQQGCCRKCGYNLTGNTSGICPECGTEVLEL